MRLLCRYTSNAKDSVTRRALKFFDIDATWTGLLAVSTQVEFSASTALISCEASCMAESIPVCEVVAAQADE